MRLRSSKEVNLAPKPATLVSTKSVTRLLVSAIRGRQNLKPILQNIYILFCSYLSYGVGEGNYRTSVTKSGLKLKLEDSTTLSSILLTEVHNKLSLTSNDASLDQNVGLSLSDCNITDSPEEMLLFWRCCCLVVLLHPLDQTVTQKFQDVVALLRRLYSHLIYSQSEKSTDSSAHLVKQMLEVYVDEVLAERPFQECQAIPDSVSSTWQNQTICSMQMKSVLEVTAAHFLLSVPIDYTLQTFLERLIWTEKSVQSHPEVSLTVGLSLIKHPLVMSAPVIFYSHLISLVSEIIGNNSFQQKVGMNTSRSKLYLSEFYDAAILYNRHFTKVMTNSCSQLDTPGKTTHSAFQSLFQLKIFDKVNWVLVDMNHAWRAQICGTEAIVIADVMSYIKMNIHIICEAHRDDVFTFMSSLISKVNSAEINELLLEKIKAMTLQDICLLASILKLMSCSLMQATKCSIIGLSGLEFSSESKLTFSDNSPLSGIMSCLAQYNLLPTKVQQFIIESLKPDLSTHDEYWLMFAHFAGLLPLCMISGLDILVKGCLIFMLVLMNTLTRKEGFSGFSRPFESKSNAHAIPEAISSTTVTESPHNNTPCKMQMKTSSIRAASRFLRARHLTLRHQASLDRADISDEDNCNGEAYMKCFTEDANDIAELADYIECKQGKDYTSWLVDRGKYRHKRLQKFAKQRRRKMTKVCRSLGYTGRVTILKAKKAQEIAHKTVPNPENDVRPSNKVGTERNASEEMAHKTVRNSGNDVGPSNKVGTERDASKEMAHKTVRNSGNAVGPSNKVGAERDASKGSIENEPNVNETALNEGSRGIQRNLRKRSLMEPNGTRIPSQVQRTSPWKKQRRESKRWTPFEEGTLREGIRRHGRGNWKIILLDSDFAEAFRGRTNGDLKDKWRNLTKHS